MPAAQRAMTGSVGASSVTGGSVPRGVGIFSMDFRIVELVLTGVPGTDVIGLPEADVVRTVAGLVVLVVVADESGVSRP